MKSAGYHFEIKDTLTQFVAAFDSVVIKRYNRSRTEKDQIRVRYIYSPKQRVLHDIRNKAKALKLPVIAVSLGGVSRDETRVFNKIFGQYHPQGTREVGITTDPLVDQDVRPTSDYIPTPIPVNINVNMSIMARYQTDMDQILSNFIPYNNPYVIISWKVPGRSAGGFTSVDQEIRSEVLWDGSVSIDYPIESTSSQATRITADTTFTIKGWLFKKGAAPENNIFKIDTNLYALSAFETIFDPLNT